MQSPVCIVVDLLHVFLPRGVRAWPALLVCVCVASRVAVASWRMLHLVVPNDTRVTHHTTADEERHAHTRE